MDAVTVGAKVDQNVPRREAFQRKKIELQDN